MLRTILVAVLVAWRLPAAAQPSCDPRRAGEGVEPPWSLDDGLYYRYFAEHIPLQVDQSRLAVFSAPGNSWPTPSMLQAAGLSDFFLYASFDETGWHFFRLQPAATTAVIARIDAAADLLDGFFLSPVMRTGNTASELMLTEQLMVRFRPEIDLATVQQVLAAYGAGEILDTWTNNTYLTRPPVRHGVELLAVSNRLSDDPAVLWSEPDFMEVICPPVPPEGAVGVPALDPAAAAALILILAIAGIAFLRR